MSWVCLYGLGGSLFDGHVEGQAALDLQFQDESVAHPLDGVEEFDDLVLEFEIIQPAFGPGTVVPAEADLPLDAGHGREMRGA